MLDRFFKLSEQGTNVRTELLAGLTTFLTMAYIIFLQPAVLSGQLFGLEPAEDYLDFGAVMTATCLVAALSTALMGLYARYPIALAPGMGENFILVFTVIPAAAAMIARETAAGTIGPGETTPWQIGLGVVFLGGVLFLAISLCGVQTALLDAISPSMRNAIAVGIGLFIAFIGLQGAGLVVADPGQCVKMNANVASPDLLVFFFGLLVTAALHARRVRGSIVLGIVASTLLALALCAAIKPAPGAAASKQAAGSKLQGQFAPAAEEFKTKGPVSRPPSMAPTLLKMDLAGALSWPMLPFILIFLFMDLFDTLGTLVGVGEQAGFIKENQLPRAREALISDAIGTVAGAVCGTSTVTSFIESTAGVEQGGRTGLTALVVAFLFLIALFFAPLIKLIGSYPSITAPALVVVGTMMMRNVTKIDWENYAEALPAFITFLGIPLTYSIADGLALGFVSYPIVKLAAGQGREVKWLMYVLAFVLVAYLACVRCSAG
jgi:AGZA family xanthine/uracil permease-like MFS transporter